MASSPSHVPQRVHPLHFVSSNALMSCMRMYVLKCLREGSLFLSLGVSTSVFTIRNSLSLLFLGCRGSCAG